MAIYRRTAFLSLVSCIFSSPNNSMALSTGLMKLHLLSTKRRISPEVCNSAERMASTIRSSSSLLKKDCFFFENKLSKFNFDNLFEINCRCFFCSGFCCEESFFFESKDSAEQNHRESSNACVVLLYSSVEIISRNFDPVFCSF